MLSNCELRTPSSLFTQTIANLNLRVDARQLHDGNAGLKDPGNVRKTMILLQQVLFECLQDRNGIDGLATSKDQV